MNLNCKLKRSTPSKKIHTEEKLEKRCEEKMSLFMIGYDTLRMKDMIPKMIQLMVKIILLSNDSLVKLLT